MSKSALGPPSLLLNVYHGHFLLETKQPNMKLTGYPHVEANSDWCSGNALHFHSGGAWFKSRPGYQIFCLRFFMGFLSFTRQILEYLRFEVRGDDADRGLVGCDIILSHRWLPMFWRNVLPPSCETLVTTYKTT
jgi:hypothetical protein